MKNMSIDDELKFLKLDLQTIQKNNREELLAIDKMVRDLREHIDYLYAKLEINPPEYKRCIPCQGTGTFFSGPIMDCGQSTTCKYCNGKGYRFL